ncbi:hypothetical protein K432DRAFT_430290 [Lepidopterella palustris CBS 459.81]|uniref:HAUS augmin-like complex subunit 6 N-terminal domain-containing protein n=1 Tax=Lepidopterella palustris CBS 459.81 TaxID=1314670 RepID=A0A8E2J971_9PEZI|nr:hypothetical protein K432DRAFT_430290 [Lepidopterella palustris CBS 459.81]
MSRSTSTSSVAPSTTVNLSRSLSLKSTSQPTKPSNVTLFLTNLRLLDLDLQPDWPSITTQTFATQNAQQNQKNRIRCVEWALVRLFELWDVEEMRDKLQPFFPPLEPLQSLNLRAALYRCLNELKKNGVLGRESVLRKTMLDECKGDKFMEILALFSTAVLKKAVTGGNHATKRGLVKNLATAPILSTYQQGSLLPLAIAHRAHLRAILRRKDEQRFRYTKFAELLETKTEQINQRNEEIQTTRNARKSVSQADAVSIKKQLRENWIGDKKWLDTVLHGDESQTEDAFLNASFRDVWRTVESGGSLNEQSNHGGLLDDLESRVKQQQTRLQRWKSFHARIANSNATSHDTSQAAVFEKKSPVDKVRFDTHLRLQLGMPISEGEKTAAAASEMSRTYDSLISAMEKELGNASKLKRDRGRPTQLYERRGSLHHSSRSPTKRRKSRSDSAPKKPMDHSAAESRPKAAAPPAKPKFEKVIAPAAKPKPEKVAAPPAKPKLDKVPVLPRNHDIMSTPIDSEATLVGNTGESLPAAVPRSVVREPAIDNEEKDRLEPAANHTIEEPSVLSELTPEPPSEPSLSTEERLAEQIISSIAEATPSPIKKPRPSLMERARMSMAHTSAFQLSSTLEESPPPATFTIPEIPQQVVLDRRTSLLERTRQSMSLASQQPSNLHKARKSMALKSSRQSLYPVNQFETPRKQSPIEEKKGDSTPKEYLFSEQADYDHVFKSRPKIAQSPSFTPQVDEEEDELPVGDSMIDLVNEGLQEEVWESSPLRRPGVGKGRG